MMLCNDLQLRVLLSQDEHSHEYSKIASHVETCTRCQSRLETLAQQDTEWWTEAKSSWTELPLPKSNDDCRTNSIVIELDREGMCDESIDYEPIQLDFLEPASHPELLGRLGRYEIERVVGQGGMGVVLKGFDTELHRVVAIKVLAPHLAHRASARRRFSREAQAAAAVVHPHVIPIFNVESESSLPYLVMQFVAGPSLQSRVDQRGPLPIEEALRIAQQTASGLAAAHGQGLVHRDIKPANILLEDQVDRVLLSDFGLARTVDDASLTRTGVIAGTPFYMSPEQAKGDSIDTRSDLFSLGSVIYFMLTGHSPFRARGAMAVLHRICSEQPRPIQEINPLVPYEVSDLVDRLLAKAPGERFGSAQEVERELGRLIGLLQAGTISLKKRRAKTSARILKGTFINAAWFACGFCIVAFAVWQINAFMNTGTSKRLDSDRTVQTSSSAKNDVVRTERGGELTVARLKVMQAEYQSVLQSEREWSDSIGKLRSQVDQLNQTAKQPVLLPTDSFDVKANELQERTRQLTEQFRN